MDFWCRRTKLLGAAFFLATTGWLPPLPAQTATEENEGLQISPHATGVTLRWWGHPGRAYFIQRSEDLHLWEYARFVEAGQNHPIQANLASSSGKIFLRLKHLTVAVSDSATADFDGDHVSNDDELRIGTDPLVADTLDTDGDEMSDAWEIAHGLDPHDPSDAVGDPDADGLTNLAEFLASADPASSDGDFDGLPDAWEVQWGMAANDGDSDLNGLSDAFDDFDGDGLRNEEEAAFSLTPYSSDTDGDSMPDAWELKYDLDPTNPADGAADPDLDGASNAQEFSNQSNPLQDGHENGFESSEGSVVSDDVQPDPFRKVELWIRRTWQFWNLEDDAWEEESSEPWQKWVWLGPVSNGEGAVPYEHPADSTRLYLSENFPQARRLKSQYYFKNVGPNPFPLRWITGEFLTPDEDDSVETFTTHEAQLGGGATSTIYNVTYPPANQSTLIYEYLRLREAEPESGFDDYERYSAPGTLPKITRPPWLMVPSGQGYSNKVLLDWSHSAGPLKLATTSSSTLQVTPTELTYVEEGIPLPTTLEVTGSGEGDDADIVMTGKIAPAEQNKVKLVRAVRLPRLTFTVQPYAITLRRTLPHGFGETPAPANIPTAAQLQNRLNEIYGKQMNVFFNVNAVKPLVVSYDIGPGNFGNEYQAIEANNLKLDFATNQSQFTPEEAALYTAAAALNISANVYLYFLPTEIRGHTNNRAIPFAGYARLTPRAGLIASDKTTIRLLQTAAHEIGHLDIGQFGKGLRHPSENGITMSEAGFPLMKASQNRKRLMWWKNLIKDAPPADLRPSALLIKEEWMKFRTGQP